MEIFIFLADILNIGIFFYYSQAIFYAVASNKPEIVKILMKQKASTTVVDRHNLSPSDIALAKNFDEVICNC